MLVSPALARWSLAFGPPETFALMLLGLTTVTLLTGENALKGYISMVLGLMLAMVGFDIISGDARYAFGIPEMMDGIDFLPVAIGLFGLGEVLAGAERAGGGRIVARAAIGLREVLPTRGRLGAQPLGHRARHGARLHRSACCPAPAPRSRPSLPTRWRRRSRSAPQEFGQRRDRRRGRARSPPTTPPRPAPWCRC